MEDCLYLTHLGATLSVDLVVELTVPTEEAELSADRLWSAGATAVGWHDDAGTVRLQASFPTSEAVSVVAGEVGGRVVEIDPSWRDGWREYAEAVPVGNRLLITPSWREVAIGGRLSISIDPGGCFGSGTHPSTRLVLAELDASPPEGLSVLDVGCGSGILGIAAALLGASAVIGVDIDPEAVAVTRANATRNGVDGRVKAASTPVADLSGAFDLALVNVTAGVHASLGSEAVRLVRPGGRLILAGLLPGQWRHVADAYPGTIVARRPELDGWEGVELVTGGPMQESR